MAVWGPDAPVRDSAAADAAIAAPRPAERWIDIPLVPLIASGLPALAISAGAISGTHFGVGIFSNYALYVAMAGFYLSVLAAIAFLLILRGKRVGRVFLARGNAVWTYIAVPAGMLMALGAGWMLTLLPDALQQEMMEKNEALQPGTLGEALSLLVIVAVLAPLAEEIYFRGIMLRVFGRHLPFAVSAVLTAILFSLVHGHLFPVPGQSGIVLTGILFVLGVLLALFAHAGKSLRAPVAMHAAYNATLTLPGVYMLLTAQT
ncbi:MAG: CPBP family intramembrane metalloprotease [Alphaproteobacteria bacterium]|nr:CPBP family intramembrane metalloprotease [Alphaproteobacteria bacterium]MDX5415328.1 CPBP family intramembrane metalloprotease [Alphaproteobacteria bacterium]